MKILVHDFAGHAFPSELSRWLAHRDHDVIHAHSSGVTAGHGALTQRPGDAPSLGFVDLWDGFFERYSPLRRAWDEVRYGRKAARCIVQQRPQVVLSGNTPLLAQAVIWRAARRVGARRVYWLQDFLGRGTRLVLQERSRLAAAIVGSGLEHLETRLLSNSAAIVCIAQDFVDELDARGVDTPTTVVENWVPIKEVPVRPKDNPWSRSHGYASTPVVLYSGTLGLKHDPEHLVAVARSLPAGARLVVVTEGRGRDHLEQRKRELGLPALDLVDFVDHEVLPDVLGCADVCLVLLEPDAGTFSVPSKILAYLAAGRPVVGAIPRANLAAQTLDSAGAGVVVEPGDYRAFSAAVVDLLGDAARSRALGSRARAHAEARFDMDDIGARIETVLDLAVRGGAATGNG